MKLNRLKNLLEMNNIENNIVEQYNLCFDKILNEMELLDNKEKHKKENLEVDYELDDSDIISLKNKFDLILNKIQSLSNEIEKIHSKKLAVNPV